MNAALQLDRVSKRYFLGERGGLFGLGRRAARQELWSLQDVSLRVEPGESVGLIGHNGAGKTTTLKLLAGITRPTRGRAVTHGRLASLINLGAGFHRELTGRENIFLNGVILGLTRREVRERFDAIVEFAELGPYIDTPVKQYSSGMYARLGFAVAAHVEPDILLVDEVLSVGDVAFQDRSFRKMLAFRDRGCSILFVSHNLSAVELMCQRAIWLDHGRVRLEGASSDVVRAYVSEVDEEVMSSTAATTGGPGDGALVVEDVTVHGQGGTLRTDFAYAEPLTVRFHCVAQADVEQASLRVTVRGDYGPLFSAAFPPDGGHACWPPGRHVLECVFETLPLLPGLYRVETLVSHAQSRADEVPRALAAFRVGTDLSAFGSDSVVGLTKSRGGFLAVPYHWRLESADGVRDLPGLTLPRPTEAV